VITGVSGNTGVVGGPAFPVTVMFRSSTCSVVGGTWTDQFGIAHDFNWGRSTDHCSGGSGSMVPGYGNCTSPTGQPGQPGQYPQTIVLRDAQGHQSAAYSFPIICTG
jgi:hypothetical protein